MIKKHWPFAIVCIIILCFIIFSKDYRSEYYGEMAKRKVVSQLAAEQKTMLDWYAERMKEINGKIEDKDVDIALIGADAKKWYDNSVAANKKISTLKTCNEQLQEKNALLEGCQNYVLELNKNYESQVEELGGLWGEKFRLNLIEKDELRSMNNSLIERVGILVKENVILKSTKQKRLNFAIFGGYDILHKDIAFGVGLSFNLFPIKFRLF